MASTYKSGPKMTSPRGQFLHPSIDKIDYGTAEYPCKEGRWKTDLLLNAADAPTKKLMHDLMALFDNFKPVAEARWKLLKPETRKKLKEISWNLPYTEMLDPETEEPTGVIKFKFKMPASGQFKTGKKAGETWNRKPDVFDARGILLKKVPEAWTGTIGRVSFEVGVDQEAGIPGYFINGTGAAGISLKMVGVQIIELKTGGARDAADHGFGEEEGFSAAESTGGFDDESGPLDTGYVAPTDAGDCDF